MITIDRLENHPDAIPILAKLWHEQEASKILHPEMTFEQAQARLIPYADGKLPVLFAAFVDKKPVGICGLRAQAIVRPDLTPWAYDLIIDPDYQRHGIANLLVNETLAEAKKLQFDKVYGLTINPIVPNWLYRHGWHKIGPEIYRDTQVMVMGIEL